MTDLAMLSEHPERFKPLFATPRRRGIACPAMPPIGGHGRPAGYRAARQDLLLLQRSPQAKEMERFAAQAKDTP